MLRITLIAMAGLMISGCDRSRFVKAEIATYTDFPKYPNIRLTITSPQRVTKYHALFPEQGKGRGPISTAEWKGIGEITFFRGDDSKVSIVFNEGVWNEGRLGDWPLTEDFQEKLLALLEEDLANEKAMKD